MTDDAGQKLIMRPYPGSTPKEYGRVIFHNPAWCYGPAMSPAVHGHWHPRLLELLIEADTKLLFMSNDVDFVCTQFLAWCFRDRGVDPWYVAVHNLPDVAGDGGEAAVVRYTDVMRKIREWEHQPYLVNIDNAEITQGGRVVLARAQERSLQNQPNAGKTKGSEKTTWSG